MENKTVIEESSIGAPKCHGCGSYDNVQKFALRVSDHHKQGMSWCPNCAGNIVQFLLDSFSLHEFKDQKEGSLAERVALRLSSSWIRSQISAGCVANALLNQDKATTDQFISLVEVSMEALASSLEKEEE